MRAKQLSKKAKKDLQLLKVIYVMREQQQFVVMYVFTFQKDEFNLREMKRSPTAN